MRKIFLSVFLAIVLIGAFVWVGQRESRIEAQTLYRETRGIVLKYLEKISNPTDDVIQFESQGGTYNENLKLNLDGNNTVTISSGSGASLNVTANTTFSGTLYGAPFMMVITKDGQYTSSVANLTTFQMPFKATVIEVSVCARDIDTTDGDETYQVDIKEGGTTILNSTMNITADNTVVVGTLDDTSLADDAKITVDLTLGGTSPALDDLTILITLKRAP